jgi:hypothetical protein
LFLRISDNPRSVRALDGAPDILTAFGGVDGRDVVCVPSEAARSTAERAACGPVPLGDVAAVRARLGGGGGVDEDEGPHCGLSSQPGEREPQVAVAQSMRRELSESLLVSTSHRLRCRSALATETFTYVTDCFLSVNKIGEEEAPPWRGPGLCARSK